jgi:hypothetical protein
MEFSAFKEALSHVYHGGENRALDEHVLVYLRERPTPDSDLTKDFLKVFTKRAMMVVESDRNSFQQESLAAAAYCRHAANLLLPDEQGRDLSLAFLLSREARLLSFVRDRHDTPEEHLATYSRLMTMFENSTLAIDHRKRAAVERPLNLLGFIGTEHRQRSYAARRLHKLTGEPAWMWRAAEDTHTGALLNREYTAPQLAYACILYGELADSLKKAGADATAAYRFSFITGHYALKGPLPSERESKTRYAVRDAVNALAVITAR